MKAEGALAQSKKIKESMGNDTAFRALIAPVVAVLFIFGGVVLSLLLTGAQLQDEAEVRRSLQIVQSAFQIEGNELGRLAVGLARSDISGGDGNAVFDPEAVQAGLMPIRRQRGDVGVVLFDGDNTPVYSNGAQQNENFNSRLQEIAANARALPESPPDAVVGYVSAGKKLFIAAASATGPDGVLVLLQQVDDALLAHIGRTFLLDGLRVEMPPEIVATIGMRIESPEGGVMALVTWTPAAYGRILFDYLFFLIVIASLITSMLLVSFLRTAMRTTQRLKEGAAALAESGDALEHSETKLAALIDGVADGIVTLDEDGKITSANASVLRIFGYDTDEIIGQPGNMLIMDSTVAGASGQAAKFPAADPSIKETEYREFAGRRKDGGRFTMDTAISHITYGSSASAVVIMRDITERKQAEETLNLLATGMALVDRDCRLLLANRSASRLFDFNDGLALAHGKITAARRDQVDQLRELVYRTCTGGTQDGEGAQFSGVMTIERGDDIRPLSLMVAPVQLVSEDNSGSKVAAIFIRDLEVRQSVPPEVLSTLFGLTPAEARVVVELVKGKRPQEVADGLNVSLNTVRNQLKQIFSKTNTGRQSELISLVLSSAAFVSEHGITIDEEDGDKDEPPIKLAGGA